MEELFKKLNPNEELPSDLKQELISSLDSLTLFADIVDLFTVKAIETEVNFLDLAGSNEFTEKEKKSTKK